MNKEGSGDILLGENDEDHAHLVALILRRAGFSVRVARDGRQVLSEVEAQPPDLILMDWWMPGVDGLECARQIKQRLPHLIIIALTANILDGDRQKALAAGCDSYLSKPIHPTQLVDEVRRWLPGPGR